MVITTIRDNVRGRCLGLEMRDNEKEAIREFMVMLSKALDNKDGLLYFYPGDFDLWYLGEFNESDFTFSSLDDARVLYRGSSFITLQMSQREDVKQDD